MKNISQLPLAAIMEMASNYADCLRAMQRATQRGVRFALPAELAPLAKLDAEALDALIGLEQAFARKRQALHGVRQGRPPKDTPQGFAEAVRSWQAGEVSCAKTAASLGMSPSTFRSKAEKLGQSGSGDIMTLNSAG